MHACRRDSFITHRAFCDALADEANTTTNSPTTTTNTTLADLMTIPVTDFKHPLPLPLPLPSPSSSSAPLFSSSTAFDVSMNSGGRVISATNMSATALLQKAAQIGATAGGGGGGSMVGPDMRTYPQFPEGVFGDEMMMMQGRLMKSLHEQQEMMNRSSSSSSSNVMTVDFLGLGGGRGVSLPPPQHQQQRQFDERMMMVMMGENRIQGLQHLQQQQQQEGQGDLMDHKSMWGDHV